MERRLPLWLFLLCFLCWTLFTVAFGWVVRNNLVGNNRAGALGDAAVVVASFPSLTKEALSTLLDLSTGDYKDKAIRTPQKGVDYSGFKPIATVPGLSLPGILVRAGRDQPMRGWRILSGAFSLNGQIENAVLLISPDLMVIRAIKLNESQIGASVPEPKYRKIVHGVEVSRDGSTVFAFDGGISLQRFDACGKRLWAIPGYYSHAVTEDAAKQGVWTVRDKQDGSAAVVRFAIADGKILQTITMRDIIDANPNIGILTLRMLRANDLGTNKRNTQGKWLNEPFHLNDVEPLPTAIADRFENFEAGDLLISARSLNLLFVLDPKTLHVKWWRVGATEHQHDPDWMANGEISVLNNRMGRDYSEIKAINPSAFRTHTLLDGRKHDFYTRIRGKHQVFEDGRIVVTSPQQGRAFEVDGNGKETLEIVNLKPDDHAMTYAITELRWLPPDYFQKKAWQCPS